MNSLLENQIHFANSIIYGNELPSAINPAYLNYRVETALDIYRNNFRGNLHDALAGAYPVIEQLVGKEFFRFLTRQYIGQHHSRSCNLNHYGDQMANFVTAFEPARDLVYLADVASLEWACHLSYLAPDADTLSIVRLSQISQEQYPFLVLLTNPACHVVQSCYPIADIWHAHQLDASNNFHIDLETGPCNALVSRKDGVVMVSKLTEADTLWMKALRDEIPLGEAVSVTSASYPDFDLQAALVNAVAQDVIVDFRFNSGS